MSEQNEQLAALKAAAEAATPGVWSRDRVSGLDADVRALHADFPHKGYPVALCWGLWKPGSKETEAKRKAQANANAEFIAAANPATILALIAEVEAARRAQPAPTVQAEPSRSTDLSKRLRAAADSGFATNLTRTDILAAAAEIERYYGGMLNWKRTAEAKDAAPAHASSDGRDAVEWLRNNYQSYPNIADLCEAMRAALAGTGVKGGGS